MFFIYFQHFNCLIHNKKGSNQCYSLSRCVYDQTVEAFHIKNRSHVNLMKSIRNDFSGVRPYSEIFIRFMDSFATVVRLELSPEKLLAFQTDGEKWNKLQEIYNEAGSMETAIEKYKQLKQKSYETEMSM